MVAEDERPQGWHVQWGVYVLAAFLPLIGVVLGIVMAARSEVGPALALWAASFAGALLWAGSLL